MRLGRSTRFQADVWYVATTSSISLDIYADNCCAELYDPMTIMFFWRNKHMMCDFGTGNNNKLNWVLEDKQELIDILETIYRGAKKGRGLVVSPKDYSTRYRY
jgi:DIM1 family U5 snRNP protein